MTDKRSEELTILMTADTVGGVWTYALELIEALKPFGVKVHLATMGRLASPSQRRQTAAISNLYLHESPYQLEWMDNPWEDVEKAGRWLLQLEKELKPHLIHLNNYCHGQLNWKAPVLMVGHSCVLSWWKAVKGEKAPQQYQRYAKEVKEGLQAADVVTAPTKSYLECLEKWYGPLPTGSVIPNSRRKSLFKPSAKEEYILSMGRLWDEAKNISALATAAKELSWPVKIAGDATNPTNGKTAEYPNLQLLGHLSQEETARQLSKSAIYVMPAKYEPFGLSVLEAALSGCALVLGNIPSLRENWTGVACFINPDKPEELTEQLEYLINHPEVREEMGKSAQKRAAAFTPENQAKMYINKYQELLKRKEKKRYMRLESPETVK